MSKFPKLLSLTAAVCLSATPILAESLGIGRTALPDEIAAWDDDVRPDGLGLPAGQGNPIDGEEIFAERCAVCHGDFGEAVGRWPVLSGGQNTLTDERPVKTIGSYWPYLSTAWDYIYRAMPFGDAASLTPDETYAILAYILFVNDVIDDEDFVLSKENFLTVRLPNETQFYHDDRRSTEYNVFTESCMQNCKPKVEITKRAAVVDVTPEETKQRKLEKAVKAVTSSRKQPKVAENSTTTTVASAQPVETPAAETETPAEAAATSAPADPAQIAKGEKLFKKCKACHQVGDGAKNRSGPILNDLVGREVGALEGFKFSAAFKTKAGEGMIWTEENLDAFLTKPKSFIPGTKMSYSGMKKETDRKAIIAFLKSHGS